MPVLFNWTAQTMKTKVMVFIPSLAEKLELTSVFTGNYLVSGTLYPSILSSFIRLYSVLL